MLDRVEIDNRYSFWLTGIHQRQQSLARRGEKIFEFLLFLFPRLKPTTTPISCDCFLLCHWIGFLFLLYVFYFLLLTQCHVILRFQITDENVVQGALGAGYGEKRRKKSSLFSTRLIYIDLSLDEPMINYRTARGVYWLSICGSTQV